jgi:hypothetical protein
MTPTPDHLCELIENANPFENVRLGDPETSYWAAFANVGHRVGQRWHVWFAIVGAGVNGLTDEETSHRTGFRLSSADKRRGELMKAGLVVDSGRRRPTTSRSPAIVWVAWFYA